MPKFREYTVILRILLVAFGLFMALSLPADWQKPERVSTTANVSTAPTVTCSPSGETYIAWQEGAEFNAPEIFFAKKSGSGWTTPLNLSNSNVDSNLPSLGYISSKGMLCLVWYEEEGMLSSAVYFKNSTDGGKTWSTPQMLSPGMESTSQFPHFTVDSKGLGHLVWSELFNVNGELHFDIVYRRYDGKSWSEMENASHTPEHSADHPSVWGQGASKVVTLFLNNNKTSHEDADWSIATTNRNGGVWSEPVEIYRGGRTPITTRVVQTSSGENYFFFHTRGPGTGDIWYCYQRAVTDSISTAKLLCNGISDKTRFYALEDYRGAVHVFSGGPGGLAHQVLEGGEAVKDEMVTTEPCEGPWASYDGAKDQIHLVYQNSQDNEIYHTIGEPPYDGNTDPNKNRAPRAMITMDKSEGICPLRVTFSGRRSSDSDGKIVSYRWDFGNGATASSVSASHVYTSYGDYTVKLRVTDNKGASDTAYAAVYAQGLEPPLAIQSVYHLNQSVFMIEHVYRVVWQENPVNAERGFDVVAYNVYRRHRDEGQYTLIGGVDAGQEFVYLDRSLKQEYQPYFYTVTAVDGAGRESPLPQVYVDGY